MEAEGTPPQTSRRMPIAEAAAVVKGNMFHGNSSFIRQYMAGVVGINLFFVTFR